MLKRLRVLHILQDLKSDSVLKKIFFWSETKAITLLLFLDFKLINALNPSATTETFSLRNFNDSRWSFRHVGIRVSENRGAKLSHVCCAENCGYKKFGYK